MGVQIDRCRDGLMYRQVNGYMDRQIGGQTDRRIVVVQMNVWLDEIDLQTNNKFFNSPELFLFLKGMTSALAPFSYLVFQSN